MILTSPNSQALPFRELATFALLHGYRSIAKRGTIAVSNRLIEETIEKSQIKADVLQIHGSAQGSFQVVLKTVLPEKALLGPISPKYRVNWAFEHSV